MVNREKNDGKCSQLNVRQPKAIIDKFCGVSATVDSGHPGLSFVSD